MRKGAAMNKQQSMPRVPEALRPVVEEIIGFTDAFCAEHLDAEYGELCRKVVAKLARKRPSPLLRGDSRIWAGGVIYAVGSINFLFDKSQTPHLSGDDLSRLTGIAKSTLGNKAKAVRDALKLNQLSTEFWRRELIESSALPWMIMVNGLIVDARMMPPEIQDEARRRGLIPDLRDRS